MSAQKKNTKKKKKASAVGLLSGGLDSLLAAKVITSLGIRVYGLNFVMPWSISGGKRVKDIAREAGIGLETIQLGNDYLKLIKNPKHGYGNAFNPCVDCHAYMLRKAKNYMKKIGADFVFTGEVLGQRPMSQLKQSLSLVAKESGLGGRLLRPLSAHFLEPTVPEKEGIVDKNKLLSISGRSRRIQQGLAKKMQITNFIPTGGGCSLTDKHFGYRMKDLLKYGCRDFKEARSLKWGRHFRISDKHRVIIGRNEKENELLVNCASKNDYIVELKQKMGPAAILKGPRPNKNILSIAGALVQRYSKFRTDTSIDISYRQKGSASKISLLNISPIPEAQIESMKI